MKKISKPAKRKRLFFDIETSPNIILSWRTGYKLNIGYHNIINERAIICIAYKWEGQKTVHALKWDRNQNDKKMLEQFAPILESANEVIGQNCDSYDIKWVRTRCLFHGIPLNPTFISHDTLKVARSQFRFNSNKLDYIASFLGYGGKKPTNFQLWKDILLYNDSKAMTKMISYCKHDVLLLENIWNRFMPHVAAKSNIAKYIFQCPECGSSRTIINQRRKTAQGYKKITFRCKDCGKYHTVAESRFNKDKEKAGK